MRMWEWAAIKWIGKREKEKGKENRERRRGRERDF